VSERDLRVLHVVPSVFGESDEFFGGAERYAYELARAMAKVTPTALLTFGPTTLARSDGPLTIKVLRNWIHFRRFRFDPVNPFVIKAIRQADIVHYHQTHTIMSGFAAVVGRLLGKPVLTTDAGAGGYGLHRLMNTRDLYAGHLHISEFSRRHFGHTDLSTARVIHGGIDPSRFNADPSFRRGGEVLFVGRLLPHKGIDYLIEAVGSDIPLRIIGRSFRHAAEYEQLLHRLAEGKQVSFNSRCSDAELVEAYQTALCIVLPSVYRSVDGQQHVIPELLGLTLLEGMASRAPAICTAVTSMPEIVEDGISGFVVPPNDPVALRERIVWLQDHPIEAARMGEAARRRAIEGFSWDLAVQECLSAYLEAVTYGKIGPAKG